MRYVDFRDLIQTELQNNPRGLTWVELKNVLKFSYKTPCPTWINKMEEEIGLVRLKGKGRALIWNLDYKSCDTDQKQ